jgi:hypothetical protein
VGISPETLELAKAYRSDMRAGAARQNLSVVMAGLDPAIHEAKPQMQM